MLVLVALCICADAEPARLYAHASFKNEGESALRVYLEDLPEGGREFQLLVYGKELIMDTGFGFSHFQGYIDVAPDDVIRSTFDFALEQPLDLKDVHIIEWKQFQVSYSKEIVIQGRGGRVRMDDLCQELVLPGME